MYRGTVILKLVKKQAKSDAVGYSNPDVEYNTSRNVYIGGCQYFKSDIAEITLIPYGGVKETVDWFTMLKRFFGEHCLDAVIAKYGKA